MLIVGLGLMVFEFYTLGIGLAGITGAFALLGASFAFSHLPVHWWAVGLLALSFYGFSVDVQATHLGFWTGVGVITAVLGAVFLYGGSSLLDVPWWLIVVGVTAEGLFMLGGMTVAVRNRCAVPTVGRDSMIGEVGQTHTALTPEGVVVVRGAPWRARVRRGRKIEAGLAIKVVAVDRLVLEVEPSEVV
jgi:membrane-bound serine protease (ClpP class)